MEKCRGILERVKKQMDIIRTDIDNRNDKIEANVEKRTDIILENKKSMDASIDEINKQNDILRDKNDEAYELLRQLNIRYQEVIDAEGEVFKILAKELELYILYLTAKKKLELTEDHPYSEDHDFLGKLLKYHEDREEYEECSSVFNLMRA